MNLTLCLTLSALKCSASFLRKVLLCENYSVHCVTTVVRASWRREGDCIAV